MTSIANMRRNYDQAELIESAAPADPMTLFAQWFQEADGHEVIEANAMTLGTVNQNNEPESRIVLLKEFDSRGFIFFTNYTSDKAQSLANNPNASLLFFWFMQQRQVRINGITEKISPEESAEYFQSRPLASRIGAWASKQSQIVTRQKLEERVQFYEESFGDRVPTPNFWGGYLIKPQRIEFWQGRPSRLHDRLRYQRNAESWERVRLAP